MKKNGRTLVVIDGLWGDGGKGKIAAHIAQNEDYDIAVRAGTGTNAGHSIYIDGKLYKTNQLPIAGIFPNKSGKKMLLAIGSGVCVNPDKLHEEITRFDLIGREIFVDRLCPVILPEHIERESKGENYSESHTGSTKSGTGESRVDRVKRTGLTFKQWCGQTRNCIKYVGIYSNVSKYLNIAYDEGQKIVIEGTQGYYLSLYLSDEYPVVTSDNCTTGAFVDDVGLAWNKVDEVCMVIKSAPTRVSQKCGDLPGEISKEDILAKGIAEYGVTSGRLRRKSLDIPFDLLEESVRVNAPTYFALTFCDHVDATDKINEVPKRLYKSWIKENMPKTFSNIEELENRFGIPVKYIEYGKEFENIREIVCMDGK